jgi:hypothetical protein
MRPAFLLTLATLVLLTVPTVAQQPGAPTGTARQPRPGDPPPPKPPRPPGSLQGKWQGVATGDYNGRQSTIPALLVLDSVSVGRRAGKLALLDPAPCVASIITFLSDGKALQFNVQDPEGGDFRLEDLNFSWSCKSANGFARVALVRQGDKLVGSLHRDGFPEMKVEFSRSPE